MQQTITDQKQEIEKYEENHYEAFKAQCDYTGKQTEIDYLIEDKKKLWARISKLLEMLNAANKKELKKTDGSKIIMDTDYDQTDINNLWVKSQTTKQNQLNSSNPDK